MGRHQALLCLCLVGAVGGAFYDLRAARIRQFSPPSADDTFTAVGRKQHRDEAALLPVGSLAPNFDLPTSDGGTLSLTQARRNRKAILVNFGFITCAHCQAELPLLVGLHKTLQGKGLATILIDAGDAAVALQQWKIRNHVNFPVAMAGTRLDMNSGVLSQYGVATYPTTYLIGADGRILWREVGEANETTLRAALAQVSIL